MAEDDLRAAMTRLEAYKDQAGGLARQSEVLRLTLEEYTRARETLRRYKESEEGSEILVPVGGSSFLHAAVASPGRALVGVGSDVIMEDDIDASMERLQRRIDHLTAAAEEVSRHLKETDSRIQTLTQQVQDEYSKLQAERGAEG